MTVRSTVISDASFCPRTRAGGWATWININWPDGKHLRLKETGRFHKLPKNSTEAEGWAAYNGIWLAYHNGARDILVQTDCLAIVQRMEHPSFQWPEACVRWRHVKGHNLGNVDDRRTWVNDWCDKQAKRNMRKQRRELQRR